jgi:hypothetical protein
LIALLSLLSIPAALAESRSKEKATPAAGKFSVPVIVDGVRYAPKDMARFNGRTMHYVVDREAQQKGVLYAFTTSEGRQNYLITQSGPLSNVSNDVSVNCIIARFNKVAYGTGIDWLTMYCGQSTTYVGSNWNNTISYVEGGGSYTVLYSVDNFQGDTFTVQGGVTVYDLHPYGFNNRTSSIKVCVSQPPSC